MLSVNCPVVVLARFYVAAIGRTFLDGALARDINVKKSETYIETTIVKTWEVPFELKELPLRVARPRVSGSLSRCQVTSSKSNPPYEAMK